MLLTNHTLTGVALGLSIDNPAVLLPTAVASHLAMDAVPHFGFKVTLRDRKFIVLATVDCLVSLAIMISFCLIYPTRALQIVVGVFGAAFPDLTYIPVSLFGYERIYRWLPIYKPWLAFLAKIQWFEKPIGLITEIVWALFMLIVINFVR